MADQTFFTDEPKTFHSHGRFYASEFPQKETTVVVTVNKMDDKIGAYVSLLEYDQKEGMINLGKLSKKRIRSMAKVLRIGSTEVCMVHELDEDKGYINLSKKRVDKEDIPAKLDAFAKAKAVHSVMQHIASTHNISVEDICEKVSWPLNEKYNSAFEPFKRHIQGDINIWDEIDFSIGEMDLSDRADKLKEDIETHMRRRLSTSQLRLQAKCEVSCSEYEGIDAIIAAVEEGFKASKEDYEIAIKLIAHPAFALSCMCRDKTMGVKTLEEAMQLIKNKIEEKGGEFKITQQPVISNQGNPGDGSGSGSHEGSEGSDGDGSDAESDPQDETMGGLTSEQMAA